MAFEDRTASNSPSCSPPFTCTTIRPNNGGGGGGGCGTTPTTNIFRIASFALPPSPLSTEPNSTAPASNHPPVRLQSSPPAPSSPPTTLKYSICNILSADFGKAALQRSRTAAIFKPYTINCDIGNDKNSNKPNETIPIAGSQSTLGSLCQAVQQIGAVPKHTKVLSQQPSAAIATSPKPALPSPEELKKGDAVPTLWPAWVYCTRYSDRPSSGPRSRRMKKPSKPSSPEDKRPRTAFSSAQLARLKQEFTENRYLTERRRQQLSTELGLNEAQIKIWFQNKRAKIKKTSGQKNPLALHLMAQGLYNHTTVPCDEDDMPLSP